MPTGREKADKLVVLNDKEDALPGAQAYTYTIDAKTGSVISKRPRVGREDKYITVGARGPSGGGRGDSAQTKYYLQVLADYRRAMLKGGVPEELANQAYDAAENLGLDTYWESDIKTPGFLEKIGAFFSGDSAPDATETKTPRVGPKAPPSGALPAQAMDAIKKANGKVVTFQNGRRYRWQDGQAVEVK